MTDYRERLRHVRPDGQSEVTIEEGDHGLFSFTVWRLYDPAPDIPEVGGPTWVPSKTSGLYATLADAEAAAASECTWVNP